MRQTNPILSHPPAAWRTRTIRILDSLPQHGMTPAATLGTLAQLVPGSGTHTGGVAKPPSLGSAGGDGGAAIRQATRLRVLSVLVPILSAEGVGAPANPPPMSRKEALGLMFVCLSLLVAPSGPKENRTSDIGRGIPQNEASDSPLFPITCHEPESPARAWSRRISADSSSVFLLVQRRAIQPASLWSMSASVSSPPSWTQTWGSRVSLPAGRPWSHQVLRSGTRGCNAGVLACSQMKGECGRTPWWHIGLVHARERGREIGYQANEHLGERTKKAEAVPYDGRPR